MKSIISAEALNLNSIDAIAFSGGGNRCWWQAGVLRALNEYDWTLPGTLTGTSAGAAIAASAIMNTTENALSECLRLYAENNHILKRRSATSSKLQFAHKVIYPEWLSSFLNVSSFDLLRNSRTTLKVAITRPSTFLGHEASIIAGTFGYFTEKFISKSIHPKLPRWLGLKQEFIEIKNSHSMDDVKNILLASASAPPFLSSVCIGDDWAFDGGYYDSVPLTYKCSTGEMSTLILLTRFYNNKPILFRKDNRTYWQPSKKIPVSTWDCTYNTTVIDAYNLGYTDAKSLLSEGYIKVA